MVTRLIPVNMTDEMLVQTLRYLNRNPKACFDRTTPIYSESKNYFKRNFDWSSEHFDERLSRIGNFNEKELFKSRVNKGKIRSISL